MINDPIKTIYEDSNGTRIPLEKCSKRQTEDYINKLWEAKYRAMAMGHDHASYYIDECLNRAEARLERFVYGSLKEKETRPPGSIIGDDEDDEDLTI